MKSSHSLYSIQLWRGFFPSWKFFDQVGAVPILYYRASANADEIEVCVWEPATTKIEFKWWNFFYNPHVNFLLFTDTLIRQFVQDVQQAQVVRLSVGSVDGSESVCDPIEQSPSFQLVKNHVFRLSQRRWGLGPQFVYQFKIEMREILQKTSQSKEAQSLPAENLLVSAIYGAEI